jgi:hypothetical protein
MTASMARADVKSQAATVERIKALVLDGLTSPVSDLKKSGSLDTTLSLKKLRLLDAFDEQTRLYV